MYQMRSGTRRVFLDSDKLEEIKVLDIFLGQWFLAIFRNNANSQLRIRTPEWTLNQDEHKIQSIKNT